MPTVDQAFIEIKIMEYMEMQGKVYMTNLLNQFSGFSPDLVDSAISDLISLNSLETKYDENGKEFVYLGPNR